MRRIALTSALVVGIVVALALGLGASGDASGYRVRAIFDNASNIVKGEDVKVAGAKVGSVDSLDVTKDKKAAVVLRIEKSGFSPFHADARCTIRPQSLIGEKYVQCEPGSTKAPELGEIPDGRAGAGQHLLPLKNDFGGGTSSPVDLDLVNNTLRRPFRERLAILLREFGTALGGRGDELNEAIHRANPALRETDEVLAILASQNRTLSQLAVDSDRVLAPLAARRKRVSDFIVQANATGAATAERSAALERTFERFPTFLRELRPTLVELGALSDEMTPVLVDLDRAAPDLNRFVLELGPFSDAATPALRSLGAATDVGGPALKRSRPLIRDLATFAEDARPVATNLDLITRSLDKSGGIERIMDYLFFQMLAVNGFDGLSHYLRAELLTNLCSTYAVDPTPGCNSNFTPTQAIRSGAAGKSDKKLGRMRARLRSLGSTLESGSASKTGSGEAGSGGAAPGQVDPFAVLQQLVNPAIGTHRNGNIERTQRDARPRSGAAEDAAIDWLLGNDAP
jgi:virulence factor Mce-like protein